MPSEKIPFLDNICLSRLRPITADFMYKRRTDELVPQSHLHLKDLLACTIAGERHSHSSTGKMTADTHQRVPSKHDPNVVFELSCVPSAALCTWEATIIIVSRLVLPVSLLLTPGTSLAARLFVVLVICRCPSTVVKPTQGCRDLPDGDRYRFGVPFRGDWVSDLLCNDNCGWALARFHGRAHR